VRGLPPSNGKVAVAGFCWGGSQTFRFATHRPDLAAAFVFYGSGPESAASIQAPVYGFYGGNDTRVNGYEGAGHGFMRSREAGRQPGHPQSAQTGLAELARSAGNVVTRTGSTEYDSEIFSDSEVF
jgi:carboxymethylenebutenolidase